MKRRQFAMLMVAIAGRIALAVTPLSLLLKRAWAQTRRRLLPAQTDPKSLIYEDPELLDPHQMAITPVDQFNTMGLTEHPVNLERWRLTVGGAVAKPLTLSLDQIKALPVLKRDVLLICPGVFAYYARWQGISLNGLLQQAGIEPQATHVDVTGPSGKFYKMERFALGPIRSEKVFLAYGVNGVPLPEKHGFPLRVVAEGQVGSQWIKFVDKIEAVVAETAPKKEKTLTPGPAYPP